MAACGKVSKVEARWRVDSVTYGFSKSILIRESKLLRLLVLRFGTLDAARGRRGLGASGVGAA
jgi:hypothetical protein